MCATRLLELVLVSGSGKQVAKINSQDLNGYAAGAVGPVSSAAMSTCRSEQFFSRKMPNLLTVESAYYAESGSSVGGVSIGGGLSPLSPSSVVPSSEGSAYGDPIMRVMEVLDVLMSELSDSVSRNEANRWLIDFQKSKESSGLVLGILYAALYHDHPGRYSEELVSHEILASIGTVQPAAQQQLLFFIAQTLASKLRRSLARPELSSDVGICNPLDLLTMSRRALDLPHFSLSQYLALSGGHMCILLIDKTKCITHDVQEIINACLKAISDDGLRFLVPLSTTNDILPIIMAKPSVDAVLAFEICTAFATGAHQISSNRLASPVILEILKNILIEITIEIVHTQHETVHTFLANLAISEHPNWNLLLKAALQRYTEYGDLTVTIFRGFFDLHEALPADSDIQSVCKILLVLIKMSTKLLAALLEMINSGRLSTMIANSDFPSDLIEAITHAAVNTIEQVLNLSRTIAFRCTALSKRSERLPVDLAIRKKDMLTTEDRQTLTTL